MLKINTLVIYENFEIECQEVSDKTVPFNFIVFVKNTETGAEDYRFFNNMLEVNKKILDIMESF